MCASIQFIGYSASVKMLRNSAVMIAPRMSQPQTGCVTTASIRSDVVMPLTVPERSTTCSAMRPIAS